MAVYSLPQFNLFFDLWRAGHTPAADPPDQVHLPCQLYLSSRGLLDIQPGSPDFWVPPIFLRCNFLFAKPARDDIVEVTAGSSDYYKVRWCQTTHLGFPNQYFSAVVEQCTAAGVTPRP